MAGNIRELENVIERAVILTTDGLIRPDLLPPAMQAPCALCSLRGTLPDALEQLERQLITEALQDTAATWDMLRRRSASVNGSWG